MKSIPTSFYAVMACAGALMASCTIPRAAYVPDMPYKPRPRAVASTPLVPVANPMQADAAPAIPPGAVPSSMLPSVTAPKPAAPVAANTPGRHITQPTVPAAPKPSAPKPAAPKPVTATPPAPATPAPATTVTAPAPAPSELISNDGPIPVATRVPGDPLRVYNPLDPSKTIKITDKNGNPQPSGKKLRVPKTNFYFYVP